MIITKEIKEGMIQEQEMDLVTEIVIATRGNYSLALDLIAFRQIANTNYYVNGIGQIVEKVDDKIKFLHIVDKGSKQKSKDDEGNSIVTNAKGYQQVKIENRKPYVHRLVAINFLNDTTGFEKADINHKDFIKYNNKVWNLEWCNKEYNNEHMRAFKEVKNKKLNGYIHIKLDLENYISLKEFKGNYFYLEKENVIHLVQRKKKCINKVLYLNFKEKFEEIKKSLLEQGYFL